MVQPHAPHTSIVCFIILSLVSLMNLWQCACSQSVVFGGLSYWSLNCDLNATETNFSLLDYVTYVMVMWCIGAEAPPKIELVSHMPSCEPFYSHQFLYCGLMEKCFLGCMHFFLSTVPWVATGGKKNCCSAILVIQYPYNKSILGTCRPISDRNGKYWVKMYVQIL